MRSTSLLAALLLTCSVGILSPIQPAHAAVVDPVLNLTAYPGQTIAFPSQPVAVTGELDGAGRTVTLQKLTSSWTSFDTAINSETGTYELTAQTTATSRRFRVTAPEALGFPAYTSPELLLKTMKDSVSISLLRVGNNLVASGLSSHRIAGRKFALQVKSGTTWKPLDVNGDSATDNLDKATSAADGTIMFQPTAVNGTKTYRIVGDPVTVPDTSFTSSATSAAKTFTPSPTRLGKNVLYVTTSSGGMPTIKGKDYPGSAVIVSGNTYSVEPLTLETIAVRGNSTATKPKKPYKLKFDAKQTPFGMVADKTWVLLANYGDRTLIRSRVAFDLGRKQNGLKWTPSDEFTELFINGSYLGSYQITQSIKIDKARVDVKKKTGQVMEHDPHWVTDETEGFKGPSGMNYSYKDPDECKTLAGLVKTLATCRGLAAADLDPESLTPDRFDLMKKKLLQFERVLYGSDGKKDWSHADVVTPAAADDWMSYLDLNSAVDYILAREFTKDNDADFYRSNFFHTNNYLPFFNDSSYPAGATSTDKFVMGPIWDFDRSAGAPPSGGTGISNTSGWWTKGTGSPNHDTNTRHWFTRIWKDPRFVAAVKARWLVKRANYKDVPLNRVNAAAWALDGYVDRLDPFTGSVVANNDRARWGSAGSRYAAKSSTFVGEINWVRNWYKSRYNWMDTQLTPSGQRDPIG